VRLPWSSSSVRAPWNTTFTRYSASLESALALNSQIACSALRRFPRRPVARSDDLAPRDRRRTTLDETTLVPIRTTVVRARPSLARSIVVIDLHRRQVFHLVLRETDLDTIVDAGPGADRNGDFFFTPEVSFVEQDVGHVVGARIDDESPDAPDAAVRPAGVQIGLLG
jgi:hypothetical protein